MLAYSRCQTIQAHRHTLKDSTFRRDSIQEIDSASTLLKGAEDIKSPSQMVIGQAWQKK